MEKRDLKDRTKKFAIEVIHFTRSFPKNDEGFVLGKQVLGQTIVPLVKENQQPTS